MRRYLSLYLSNWALDVSRRQRKKSTASPSREPEAAVIAVKGRREIYAANPEAKSIGIVPCKAVADAQAIAPALKLIDADPQGDLIALEALACWCVLLLLLPILHSDDVSGAGLWIAGMVALLALAVYALAISLPERESL